MRIVWTPEAWADYLFWQQTDRKLVVRVNRLITDIQRGKAEGADDGIGKPELLRHFTGRSGVRSRRIDSEHRLVYAIDGDELVIFQARFHY